MRWTEDDHDLEHQALTEGLTGAPAPRSNGHRAPPHDDQAEAATIGAALLSHNAHQDAAAAGLRPHHFYRSAHRHLWAAIEATGPDHTLITGWLTDQKLLEAAGGHAAINQLLAEAPGTTGAARWTERIIHCHRLRRYAALGHELREAAYTDDPDQLTRALAELGETPADDTGRAAQIGDALLSSDQLLDLPAPQPLLDGLLQVDSLAMLYGPSGLAKTFLAIDWAMHVSLDAWWNGRAVTGGTVLYVVAEGVAGIGQRVTAWRTHHNLSKDRISWYPGAINLLDPEWADGLTGVVDQVQPALVVVDTYARCTLGADENSARDTGQIIDHLDRIRRAAGACVLLVHHTGKDIDRGARGHSALRGAVDTELELTGDRTHMVLRNSKQKNAAEADPIHLALLGTGPSCVVVPTTTSWESDDLPKRVAGTLTALEEVDDPAGVTASVWLAAAGIANGTFYRHRTGLLTSGLVVNLGTPKAPRYRAVHLVDPVP